MKNLPFVCQNCGQQSEIVGDLTRPPQEDEVEREVCVALWKTLNNFYDVVTIPKMSVRDSNMRDALEELKDLLEEVLPYNDEEVGVPPRRRR